MRKIVWAMVAVLLLLGSFCFGYNTYYGFLRWFWGSANLVTTSASAMLVANLYNGLLFAFSGLLMIVVLQRRNARYVFSPRTIAAAGIGLLIGNCVLFSLFVGIHKIALAPDLPAGISIDVTHQYFYPELLISTVLALIALIRRPVKA